MLFQHQEVSDPRRLKMREDTAVADQAGRVWRYRQGGVGRTCSHSADADGGLQPGYQGIDRQRGRVDVQAAKQVLGVLRQQSRTGRVQHHGRFRLLAGRRL